MPISARFSARASIGHISATHSAWAFGIPSSFSLTKPELSEDSLASAELYESLSDGCFAAISIYFGTGGKAFQRLRGCFFLDAVPAPIIGEHKDSKNASHSEIYCCAVVRPLVPSRIHRYHWGPTGGGCGVSCTQPATCQYCLLRKQIGKMARRAASKRSKEQHLAHFLEPQRLPDSFSLRVLSQIAEDSA